MKTFTKQMAWLLVLALSCAGLFSCQQPEVAPSSMDWLQAADEALEQNDYTAKIETAFSTSDDDMRDAVAALNASDMTLKKKGDDFSIEMQATVGENTLERSYVMVGGVLYHKNMLQVGEKSVSVKQKADASALDVYLALEDVSAGASIGTEDFKTLTPSKDGEVSRVLCTDVKGDTLIDLTEIFGAYFEGATLMINDARLDVTAKDGKYTQTALTLQCTVLTSSESYEVTVMRTTVYDYSSSVTVSVPEDSADYTSVSYGDIIK